MALAEPRISWRIEEYAHREKGPDWFWALGVVAIAGAAIAVLRDDLFFAIFIVLGAIILGYYAARKPDIIDVAIGSEGIMIRNYFYPFEKITGFAVEEHVLGSRLLIESTRTIAPVISIPLPESIDPEALTELLRTKVPEKALEESLSQRIMEHLGF